ncbi:MAG: hypothetical protein KAH21_07695 [Spirochaetaceae bacterium]|nr:hypothetical protein [Spirochaetaceae bacterium]
MIRRILILLFILSIGIISTAAEEAMIPRRIRIVNPGSSAPPMLSNILYAHLTLRVPLVISEDDDEPHNTIILETGSKLSITLEDREGIADIKEFPLEIINNPIAAAEAFDELAEEWEPFLSLVKPDITEELEIRREEIKAEVSFEEKLITPFQVTIWLPIAARQSPSDQADEDNTWIFWWPLRADFTWYFNENLGLTSSFRFEYGNHLSFAEDINSDSVDTKVLMLMPGIGLQVRTLGKISAEIGVSFFFGFVHITPEDDSYNPLLTAGESTWVFYPVLSLEPAIVWSPSASWSVKARILGLQWCIANTYGDTNYSGAQNSLILNYFQLGAAYRW